MSPREANGARESEGRPTQRSGLDAGALPTFCRQANREGGSSPQFKLYPPASPFQNTLLDKRNEPERKEIGSAAKKHIVGALAQASRRPASSQLASVRSSRSTGQWTSPLSSQTAKVCTGRSAARFPCPGGVDEPDRRGGRPDSVTSAKLCFHMKT